MFFLLGFTNLQSFINITQLERLVERFTQNSPQAPQTRSDDFFSESFGYVARTNILHKCAKIHDHSIIPSWVSER